MWQQHGPLDDRDDPGGDQAGIAYGLRFINPAVPGALLEVHFYAAYGDHAINHAINTGPYFVRRSTTYTLCRDVDRPGDTEEWSDAYYTTLSGPYPTVAGAETAARVLAQQFDPRSLTWNGRRFNGWSQAPEPK
jgi:hypothetical protein